MVMDTTDPGYWLNWRFLLCATWVYSCMALACYLIWKYEGPSSPAGNDEGGDREEARPKVGPGVVYLEDCWKPCLEEIHPAWLLAFRLVSFLFMASVLVSDVIVDGWSVFLFVTLYFGLGSVLSFYGCYQYACKMDKSVGDHGSYIIAPTGESTYDDSIKSSCFNKTHDGREIAGFWGYLFQIMFQYGVLVHSLPFSCPESISNEFCLLIGTHSLNALFIIGDTALNSLRFPWFRISYFMLWTGLFVSVQWIIHANVSIWVALPIPRLDIPSRTCLVSFGGGIASLPLLWSLRPSPEDQEVSPGKLVPA
ncbi:unnamed protein product [Triticum turgidum subsp. durum]|uniref:Uncharacterized protein n=1 Tax=Triticum turgidum subsp. durum TaxID=4567 RepID=A0A9R1Q8V5_TRITD|nr:unnamed protein product [Triticum turgidum subsp. durum]